MGCCFKKTDESLDLNVEIRRGCVKLYGEKGFTFISFLRYRYSRDLLIVLSATFRNISAMPWRPVLVVEEAGVPGENHRPWASNW